MAIELHHVIQAAPEAVWAVIGQPGRVDWVAGVDSATFDGDVRRFKMTGAGELAERILQCDDERFYIEYSVIESQPPLDQHLASMQLLPHAQGTELIWKTTVEPVAVEPFIKAGMEGSITGLHQVLGLD